MTREQQEKEIREACIKANPDILTRQLCGDGQGGAEGCEDDIRLADVLLAINIKVSDQYFVSSWGEFFDSNDEGPWPIRKFWNLRKDSLTDQSNECITFLHSLLSA